MKSGKSIWFAGALAISGTVAVCASLEPLVQHTPMGPAIAAMFRTVAMPGGAVPVLLRPAETRPALTALISSSPNDAALYRLRAHEAEMALDFPAAEGDWKIYAAKASDSYAAHLELADFHHRRMQPADEVAALTAAAAAPDDPLEPATGQRGWHAFERMAAVAHDDGLPENETVAVYRAWVARYPKEPEARRKLIAHLIDAKQFAEAETEIAEYGRAFQDEYEPVRMRADLEMRRENSDAALAIYDRAFQPLWPDEMRAAYFKLLGDEGRLRDFAGRTRTALAANPADLDATARLFHYFRSQNNAAAARRVLLEYRIAKDSGRQPWTPGELQTLAALFEMLPDVNEAARYYYALYSVPPAGGAHTEQALHGLAHLLLTAPGQPIQFGSGDLSFYKDIATVDPSPGFLNGVLSLVLNWTGVRPEYRAQNTKSEAYFHRAAASRLVTLVDQQFPQSQYRAPLHAALVSAYGAYGDDASVIRAGREYLSTFPSGSERVPVALQVADALARTDRTTEEFALYDQLLRELAAKASGVPIGSHVAEPAPSPAPGFSVVQPFPPAQTAPAPNGARSAEYVQVLDKYLSRLAATKRPLDALRVYRGEIDRNPNDPGLYQRLADYLEQNGMSQEVEAIYTRAIAKFGDRSWYHKLARWYLRRREAAALEKISRDAIAVFSGSELEQYFRDVVPAHPDAVLYRQLNLYAHERFPEDLVFVQNLLNAYKTQQTRDDAAAERLLRQYWFYDARLRSVLFERLSREGRLSAELAQIRRDNPELGAARFDQAVTANPAAIQFAVEAEAWLSHFEAAAPPARALAAAYPGRTEFTSQASSLFRSLAAYDTRDTAISVQLADDEHRADPRNPDILARMGDICADRDLFTRARQYWERMPATQPDKPDAYLDTATVYWDYYRYDDALRWIAAARKKFDKPTLFAYQAGAIYEGKRDFDAAAREYTAGAVDGQQAAQDRLLRLVSRPATKAVVDRATQAAITRDPLPQAVSLRIAVLEAMQRRGDLEALLQARVEAEKTPAELTTLQEDARRLGFDRIEERAGERLAAISNDPVEKMRLTLANARLLESKKDLAGAARVVDTLYRDHPLILGVIRGAVDFHERNHQPQPAIDLLLDAARHARADLAAQFTLEAARTATDAGEYERARTLLSGLLTADPLRAEYLTAMADTYLRAGDDRGFRDYQLGVIQRLKQSPLTAGERVDRVATIRRSLVPAFDRLKDSAGAVDQYIEVLNSYPEDEALAKEVAAYAVAHGQAARLIAFYRKTASDAPRDYRWPVVLGRIETVTEDYPAAISDYELAMKARPDRADVLEAKAHLEERLMRFEDAVKSCTRLYDLTYRDPEHLIKVAELRARLGQNAEAVTALRTAIIGARTETAEADFQIAEDLDEWHILPDAVTYADRGANLDGADLFKNSNHAKTFAGVIAHARRMDAVLSRLGGNPETDREVTFVLGPVIAETYTPEEKVRLEQTLTARAAGLTRRDRDRILLPLVTSSGLVDLESRWLQESMTAQTQAVDARLVGLQTQRGLYGELGRELEDYAARNAGRPVEAGAYAQSIQSFIAEGDLESQLRVMRKALARSELSGILLDRYLSLIAVQHPDELLAVIRGNASAQIRNRAVQFAIAGDRMDLAYSAVRTRGATLPPVWTNAFIALTGEYFADRSPSIDAAFQTALDTRTIGDRLQAPHKPDSVIVGSVWFYYGARYGDYLAAGKSPEADGWLPASLEAAPGNPAAYMALGDSYAESASGDRAVAEYEHAIELDPDRGDALDHIARVSWSQGRQTEAIAQWKSALDVFLKIQRRGVRVPEPFWGRLAAMFSAIGDRHAIDSLRADIANLLGDYYQINNQYRFQELVQPAARASLASGSGLDWLVQLGDSMGNPEMMVEALLRTQGLTSAQRIALQRGLVAARARRVETSFGYERDSAEGMLTQARWQLTSFLLDAGDLKGAAAEWSQVSTDQAARFDPSVEVRLASRAGTLDSLLRRYASQKPEPLEEMLLRAAVALRKEGDENGARAVQEFVYQRDLDNGRLTPSAFLGLAEVKLQRGDQTAAIELLNRMALVSPAGFDTLLPAAELLEKYGNTAPAVDFIRRRLKAEPWDGEAKLQLATNIPTASAERGQVLANLIGDSLAGYALRAQAARLTAPHTVASLSGTELGLLSSGPVAPDAAEKPYQVESRVEAARQSRDPEAQLRLWRGALAFAPKDAHVCLGAQRAAITLRRDSLSLAFDQPREPAFGPYDGMPFYRPRRSFLLQGVPDNSDLTQPHLTDAERASLDEALAAAAERLDDLATAQRYLSQAMSLVPTAQRDPLDRQRKALAAEQSRRTRNAARQPVIKDVIEQDQVVRPRILRSEQ